MCFVDFLIPYHNLIYNNCRIELDCYWREIKDERPQEREINHGQMIVIRNTGA